MRSEDNLCPQTWSLIEKTENKNESDLKRTYSLKVDLQQLRLTSLEGLETMLTQAPVVLQPSRYKTLPVCQPVIHHASEACCNGNATKTAEKETTLGKYTVNIARNGFESLNVEQTLRCIAGAVQRWSSNNSTAQLATSACLRCLCLTYNDLVEFPDLSNQCWPQLRRIYLNHNQLEAIPVSGSGSTAETSKSWTELCPCLETLDLRHNRLQCIGGLGFLLHAHPNLRSLSLSGNQLTTGNLGNFPFCPNLRLLGLFANNINAASGDSCLSTLQSVFATLADRYPTLEELYFGGNPLVYRVDDADYTKMALETFPKLQYLDGRRVRKIGTV